MPSVEEWVFAKIEAHRPGGGAPVNAMNALANACLRLRGVGGGTIFGLVATPEVSPHPALYRKACDGLAEWLERGTDDEGQALAHFVRLHALDVPIPVRFPPPPQPPEDPDPLPSDARMAAMEQRVAGLVPLWTPAEWSALRALWENLAERTARHGGRVRTPLEVGAPASVDDLARAERDLGRPLPDALVRAFLNARSLSLALSFPSGAPCKRGGFEGCIWNIGDVAGLHEESRAWALDEESDSDRLWIESIPFAGLNGSYLALRGDAVVFLEHEGDRELGHGAELSPDLAAFVDAWTRSGLPDAGEWWTLRAFTDAEGRIDPTTEAAQRLRDALGIESSRP